MNLHLNPGDPCWVRNKKGEIIKAVYDEPAKHSIKCHWVKSEGEFFFAGPSKPSKDYFADNVRFVLMPNNTEK